MHLHVDGLDGAGYRFVSAWNTAERAGPVARDHLTFESYEQFHDLLSPQRLSLLRALRRQGPISVQRLSADVGRGRRPVSRDIERLSRFGLIARISRSRITVPWRALRLDLDLGRMRSLAEVLKSFTEVDDDIGEIEDALPEPVDI